MSAPWQPERPVGRGEVLRLIRAEIEGIRVPRPRVVTLPASVSVISVGNGNSGPTTVDLSADVPRGALIAVIVVSIGGVRSSNGSFASNVIDFYEGTTTGVLAARAGVSFAEVSASASGLQVQSTVYVPLDAARKFTWQKTDALNSSSGVTGTLVGYLI